MTARAIRDIKAWLDAHATQEETDALARLWVATYLGEGGLGIADVTEAEKAEALERIGEPQKGDAAVLAALGARLPSDIAAKIEWLLDPRERARFTWLPETQTRSA